MSFLASHVLPVLAPLGLWSCWIIGLAAFLEGFWVTGVVLPGALVVVAGGALARLGYPDVLALWGFAAAGAVLGGEASWRSGRLAGLRTRMPPGRAAQRAQALVRTHGPPALVIGRLLGPVGGLTALAAALSGMGRRRFVAWNILGGLVGGLVHLALGYLAADILARVTPYLPRPVLPLVLLAALVLVTRAITRRARRGAPALRDALGALRAALADWPPLRRLAGWHPRLAAGLARRLDPGQGGGLMLTGIAVLLVYLVGLFVDGALDLAFVPGTAALDHRVSNLAHAWWTPDGLRLAAWFTRLGYVPVATLVALGSVAAFAGFGRRAAAAGLACAALGNAVTVTLLKLAFGRDRPAIGYFLETSASFPSGHAAISTALYGSLALMLWRERLIGPTLAISAGVGVAFGLGLTRLYLAEHFLSDVLNGWVVGGIWLVIGLAVSEGVRPRVAAGGRRRAVPGLAVLGACLLAAAWAGATHRPSPAVRETGPATVLSDLPGAIGTGAFPVEVLTLGGAALPPVSVVSTGAAAADVARRLAGGGWARIPDPGPLSVFAALREDLTGARRAGATVPLAFRAARPADVTLRAPGSGAILRLWSAGQDAAGGPIVAWAFAPSGHPADWSADAARSGRSPASTARARLSPARRGGGGTTARAPPGTPTAPCS
ncbi:phosphatase PAP2 family protein [Paroceanicella profunda]|uniref:Phosphatase PAP2 family protein n=1 Tax=Paroceanicella profunda TaxID=2579971 RepID=A0A5B8FW08_9RHOB|nr:phosphatase PAP2 family protein [Paroceanicella profunda]QDL90552.1 phosphatase PAP2 family protein [Paroceanicella profunda]